MPDATTFDAYLLRYTIEREIYNRVLEVLNLEGPAYTFATFKLAISDYQVTKSGAIFVTTAYGPITFIDNVLVSQYNMLEAKNLKG